MKRCDFISESYCKQLGDLEYLLLLGVISFQKVIVNSITSSSVGYFRCDFISESYCKQLDDDWIVDFMGVISFQKVIVNSFDSYAKMLDEGVISFQKVIVNSCRRIKGLGVMV